MRPGNSDRSWSALKVEEAAEWLNEVLILDVREESEFFGPMGHINGAHLVPLRQLSGSLDDLDPSQPILVVCRSGGRAAAACDRLTAASFSSVYNLAGGMAAWHDASKSFCRADHRGTTCHSATSK